MMTTMMMIQVLGGPIEWYIVDLSREGWMTFEYNNNNNNNNNKSNGRDDRTAVRDAFAKSAIVSAREVGADLILAITRTGFTANALAKFFSSVPVMVLSTSPQVCAQVLLHRSVTPYLVQSLNRESCLPRAVAKAIELGLVETGSRVLLLTGPDDMIANRLETFVVGETIISPPPPPPGSWTSVTTTSTREGDKTNGEIGSDSDSDDSV